ncbi:MAG TPA: carboxypeptidase-like regulatory domain-containing protein [Candidatus Angelobacter sp.]|nr:carboxypeptidase-like regulatory domain-containing protein [Candidatus Angelobacter sp.]
MRLTALVGTLLFCALVIKSVPASCSVAPFDGAIVEGTVVSAMGGRPLPRAKVFLNFVGKNQPPEVVSTDDAGRFLLRNIDPGTYRLSASKEGFFTDEHLFYQATIDVSEGRRSSGTLIRLLPLAVLKGRVVEQHNDPMQHVAISVYGLDYFRGQPRLNAIAHGVTDDRGEYRISGVRPGSYFLMADYDAHREWTSAFGNTKVNRLEPELAYADVFFPDTPDILQAQKVEVHAGDESEVDFALNGVPGVSIQGRILNGITGMPSAKPSIEIYQGRFTAAAIHNAQVSVHPEGFLIENVSPGLYTLRATFSEGDNPYTGEQMVRVGNGGVRNLELVAMPHFEVRGHIRTTDGKAARAHLSVEFAAIGSRSGAFFNADDVFRVSANTSDLKFTGKLQPGDHYRVRVLGLPADYYLKSVLIAGQDVPQNDLVIGGDGVDLELLISPGAGRIDGLAFNSRNEAVRGSYIALLPEGSTQIDSDLIRRTRADGNGKFSLDGLPPGSYRLLAWEDINLEEMVNNPDLFRPYEKDSQAVRIEEQGQYSVSIVPISAARSQ